MSKSPYTMIKITQLSELLTQETNLIRRKQDERNSIDRDISLQRSQVLALQNAEREITAQIKSMQTQIETAREMLDSLLGKIKRVSGNNQEETKKMQDYYERLQKKIEQATEYFIHAREVQSTVQDMEIKRDNLSQEVESLKRIIQEWNEAWNTKEKEIKARENSVKNAEIGIQYDRQQLEKAKFINDEKTIELRKREAEVSHREQQVSERERILNNPS